MLEHAVVEKILVDRGELVFQLSLKSGDDLGVALHGDSFFQWVFLVYLTSCCIKGFRRKNPRSAALTAHDIANRNRSHLMYTYVLASSDENFTLSQASL